MPETGNVFLVGTAGSGKSVLTAILRRYLEDQGINVIAVNLDPAVQQIPYTADVDCRDYVDIQTIIDQYELGPNGAIIAASDLVVTQMGEIKEEIDDFGADAVLIDTPGQFEVFVYRNSGPLIVREFDRDTTACLYLMDANLVRSPSSYISINLLAISAMFRLGLPMIYALTKADLLKEDEKLHLDRWAEDLDFAMSDMGQKESFGKVSLHSLNLSLAEAIREMQASMPLIHVSALEEYGLENLTAYLGRVWQKGDDWII